MGGSAYCLVVARRVRAQNVYHPVFEDWLFHLLLPLASHVMLTGSAFIAWSHTRLALFFLASATLILLFVGIHNAWDGITYHVFVNRGEFQASDNDGEMAERRTHQKRNRKHAKR